MNLRDPRVQKFIAVGLGSVAVLYLYFLAPFLPFGHRAVAEERGQLEQQYRQLSSDLSKARQTLTNLEEVERQYEVITRRWEVASELLPEERELAALLRKVSLVGQQSGVEFELFKPRAVMPGELYVEHPVEVKVVGGYHEVGAFLAEVANLDRIVNVTNLTMEELKSQEGEETRQTVRAAFIATAYTMNPTPAANAGGKAEGKAKGGKQNG
jgi:type IV pilus assembly protein PilO